MIGFDNKKSVLGHETDECSDLMNEENIQSLSKQDFSIFPNPTTGNITIESNFPDLVISQIIVSNLFGKVVFQNKVEYNNSYEFNIGNLSKGLYIIEIKYGNEFYSDIIIKQ